MEVRLTGKPREGTAGLANISLKLFLRLKVIFLPEKKKFHSFLILLSGRRWNGWCGQKHDRPPAGYTI